MKIWAERLMDAVCGALTIIAMLILMAVWIAPTLDARHCPPSAASVDQLFAPCLLR